MLPAEQSVPKWSHAVDMVHLSKILCHILMKNVVKYGLVNLLVRHASKWVTLPKGVHEGSVESEEEISLG